MLNGGAGISEATLQFLDGLGRMTRELTDPAELMATSARLLGSHLHATRCAYADVEPDGDHFTIRSDWAEDGVASSAGQYSLELFGPRATGNLRQGRPLIVRDVDAELGSSGGGQMFSAIGIKAVICAGLVKEGRLVAMMAVHQAMPRNWAESEIGLVEEVVDRCWAHIERVRDHALLREQDRNKDQFLAMLAHELRNPLAPLKLAASLLRAKDIKGSHARATAVIDRQVGTMSRLIADLLDLARINQGLIELQRELIDLAQPIEEAVEIARPAIDAVRHTLSVDVPHGVLFAWADHVRIVQVVSNLLNNAAKYTPDGGTISLRAWLEAGEKVVVEVADNGIGIAAHDRLKLFQMFSQLHHSVSRSQGGLGIGLSLAKNIVELHGGSISASSAGADQGSCFSFALPLRNRPQTP